MTQQQKLLVDRAAKDLVRRLREDNEAAARSGGRRIDDDQYVVLEEELRELLSRQANANRESVGF